MHTFKKDQDNSFLYESVQWTDKLYKIPVTVCIHNNNAAYDFFGEASPFMEVQATFNDKFKIMLETILPSRKINTPTEALLEWGEYLCSLFCTPYLFELKTLMNRYEKDINYVFLSDTDIMCAHIYKPAHTKQIITAENTTVILNSLTNEVSGFYIPQFSSRKIRGEFNGYSFFN